MEDFESRYKKKNPFSVPEGYFDDLTDRVMNRLEDKKPHKATFVQLVKPYIGLVAVFLVALLVVQVILPHFVDPNKMLKKGGQVAVVATENEEEETVIDLDFNPSNEEIVEYLSSEVSDYELFYAELY